MSELEKYIRNRKNGDPEFERDFELGYENFKIGAMLKEARLSAGISQQELARRINSKKSSISRMENHAEDVKLSTLERYVSALGKKIRINIA